jgi:hypothetical protein
MKGDEVDLVPEGPGLVHEDFTVYLDVCVQLPRPFELRVVMQNMVLWLSGTWYANLVLPVLFKWCIVCA